MQHFLKMDTHNRASGIRKTQKEETREYMYLFVYVFIYLGFMVFVWNSPRKSLDKLQTYLETSPV